MGQPIPVQYTVNRLRERIFALGILAINYAFRILCTLLDVIIIIMIIRVYMFRAIWEIRQSGKSGNLRMCDIFILSTGASSAAVAPCSPDCTKLLNYCSARAVIPGGCQFGWQAAGERNC